MFEKVIGNISDYNVDVEYAKKLENPQEKKYKILYSRNNSLGNSSVTDLQDCYFSCSTDEDSSDYYTSDEEEI